MINIPLEGQQRQLLGGGRWARASEQGAAAGRVQARLGGASGRTRAGRSRAAARLAWRRARVRRDALARRPGNACCHLRSEPQSRRQPGSSALACRDLSHSSRSGRTVVPRFQTPLRAAPLTATGASSASARPGSASRSTDGRNLRRDAGERHGLGWKRENASHHPHGWFCYGLYRTLASGRKRREVSANRDRAGVRRTSCGGPARGRTTVLATRCERRERQLLGNDASERSRGVGDAMCII